MYGSKMCDDEFIVSPRERLRKLEVLRGQSISLNANINQRKISIIFIFSK